MLYHLLYPLRDSYGALNVFRYQSFRALLAGLTALAISMLLGPWMIRRLKALQIGQQIRDDGPERHLVKAGTPTMGGTLILFSWLLATLLVADLRVPYVWIVVFVTLGVGLIGFVDDYRKVTKSNSKGLSARAKLWGQFAVASCAAGALYLLEFPTTLNFPFLKDLQIEFGLLYIPFAAIVIVGVSNAVNLTDGLDGLAIGPVMTTALTYGVFSYLTGNQKFAAYLQIAYIQGVGELAIFCAALLCAGLGFLWFNCYPASMFMGDVGALPLGAALGTVALITKQELVFLVAGAIFIVEAMSVVLQVGSYKLRRKRIFRMAPIHHHFELLGWPEPKIIVRFWIISVLCALLALSTLKLR